MKASWLLTRQLGSRSLGVMQCKVAPDSWNILFGKLGMKKKKAKGTRHGSISTSMKADNIGDYVVIPRHLRYLAYIDTDATYLGR